MSDRHDDRPCTQGDLRRLTSDIAKVDPRIKNLPYIPKAWVAQRNITHPECRETCVFCLTGKLHLILHSGDIPFEGFNRKKESQGHAPGLESSLVAREGSISSIG